MLGRAAWWPRVSALQIRGESYGATPSPERLQSHWGAGGGEGGGGMGNKRSFLGSRSAKSVKIHHRIPLPSGRVGTGFPPNISHKEAHPRAGFGSQSPCSPGCHPASPAALRHVAARSLLSHIPPTPPSPSRDAAMKHIPGAAVGQGQAWDKSCSPFWAFSSSSSKRGCCEKGLSLRGGFAPIVRGERDAKRHHASIPGGCS